MILFSQGVSYSGFLWDSSSGIDLKDAAVLESPVVNGNGNHTYPQLYLAHFSVRNDWFSKTVYNMENIITLHVIVHMNASSQVDKN